VFRSAEEYSLRRFIHFFLVTGTGILVIQTLVIYGVTHLLSHQQAAVVSIVDALPFKHLTPAIFDLNVAKLTAVLTAMAWNFTIYHFFIFNDKTNKDAEDAVLPY
jgi:putative flippase GtrA